MPSVDAARVGEDGPSPYRSKRPDTAFVRRQQPLTAGLDTLPTSGFSVPPGFRRLDEATVAVPRFAPSRVAVQRITDCRRVSRVSRRR